MQNAVCTMRLIPLAAALLVQATLVLAHYLRSPVPPPPSWTGSTTSLENGFLYNVYGKHHSGRHVCTMQRNITHPVKTKESYCKPVYKNFFRRCNNNQLCTGVRLVCEIASREVVTTTSTTRTVYVCCPGWQQVRNRSYGCNKSYCSMKCQNGGTCVKPNWCSCPKGFAGRLCELDIDECKEKPCDQTCHNTFGSYRCECRKSFVLQSDGQSCQRTDQNEAALEVKDLEYGSLDVRLQNIEKMLSNAGYDLLNGSNYQMVKLTSSIDKLSKDVRTLKHKLTEIVSTLG